VTEAKIPEKAPAFVTEADTTPGTQASSPWSIRMQNIGKQYRLGEVSRLNENFREDVMNWFGRFIKFTPKEKEQNTFWALKDINLEIARGETVGIIGRNGAGKSTMLKILSRITSPTTGELTYRGRLASLLEVGTGFHRELTGRENIYLNGAILGMRRTEIGKQLDAVVDFAGIEKFLDTPVKFYSSGMYVRLAFAVAAHLRTDILVVDEVLAVGDAQFQKKCLGKMQDVATDGRTVLFVSHNMGAVRSLCNKGVLLASGKMLGSISSADETVAGYLEQGGGIGDSFSRDLDQTKDCTILNIRTIEGSEGGGTFPTCSDVLVSFTLHSKIDFGSLLLSFYIRNAEGQMILFSDFTEGEESFEHISGRVEFIAKIPGGILAEGVYSITAGVRPRLGGRRIDHVADVCRFRLIETDQKNRPHKPSILSLSLNWEIGESN